jgi:acyl dehydratase
MTKDMKEKVVEVVDFIRKKRDTLVQPPFAFKGRLPPALLDHWSEFRTMAHNTQLATWIREQQLRTPPRKSVSPKPIVLPIKAQDLLSELFPKIGEELHVGSWFTIDQSRINLFAEVTADQQWIHTDPIRANIESPFKTTIAHGFLTLSLLPVLTESVDAENPRYPTAKMVVNYGLNQVRFPYPVKVGSTVRAHTKLLELTPISQGLEVVEEIRVEIKGMRRPACIAQMVLRLYF